MKFLAPLLVFLTVVAPHSNAQSSNFNPAAASASFAAALPASVVAAIQADPADETSIILNQFATGIPAWFANLPPAVQSYYLAAPATVAVAAPPAVVANTPTVVANTPTVVANTPTVVANTPAVVASTPAVITTASAERNTVTGSTLSGATLTALVASTRMTTSAEISGSATTQPTEGAGASSGANSGTNSGNSLSGGAIGGIVVGCLVGLAVIVGSLLVCIRRRRLNSNQSARTAADDYYDVPGTVGEKGLAPHIDGKAMASLPPELQGSMAPPGAELDGQPKAYMPTATAVAAPVSELDSMPQTHVPQPYHAQPIPSQMVAAEMDAPQMMAAHEMAAQAVPLELAAHHTGAPAATAPVAAASAPVVALAEGPDAARALPSPVSPASSAAEGLARLHEEELALEERKKLLLELQEVEQKRQEISDRIEGLKGGQ